MEGEDADDDLGGGDHFLVGLLAGVLDAEDGFPKGDELALSLPGVPVFLLEVLLCDGLLPPSLFDAEDGFPKGDGLVRSLPGVPVFLLGALPGVDGLLLSSLFDAEDGFPKGDEVLLSLPGMLVFLAWVQGDGLLPANLFDAEDSFPKDDEFLPSFPGAPGFLVGVLLGVDGLLSPSPLSGHACLSLPTILMFFVECSLTRAK